MLTCTTECWLYAGASQLGAAHHSQVAMWADCMGGKDIYSEPTERHRLRDSYLQNKFPSWRQAASMSRLWSPRSSGTRAAAATATNNGKRKTGRERVPSCLERRTIRLCSSCHCRRHSRRRRQHSGHYYHQQFSLRVCCVTDWKKANEPECGFTADDLKSRSAVCGCSKVATRQAISSWSGTYAQRLGAVSRVGVDK